MLLLLRNFRQLSQVTTADEKVVDDAWAFSSGDYEDALQYYSALGKNVDVIVTRNGKDFHSSQVPVLTLHEYWVQL